MAVGESAGTVYVTIDGDASPLIAKYAQAETASRAAGQRIGSALVSPLVDASGRAMSAVTTMSGGLASDLAPAANTAAVAVTRTSVAIRGLGTAAHGAVSELQATSGAIRTALGEQSIRAAERFVSMLPGVGAALQVAFPLIGAVALGSAIARVIEKSEDLKAAEKELQDQTQKTDEAFGQWVTTLDKIAVKNIGREFGPAAEARAEAARLGAEANDAAQKIRQLQSDIRGIAIESQGHYVKAAIAGFGDINGFVEATTDKIKAKGQEIEAVQAKIQTLTAQSNDEFGESIRKGQEQSGQLAAKQIESAEQASTRAAEISKQRDMAELDAQHAAEMQRIAGLDSEYARVVQTGNEEIRFEKAKQDEITGYALATRDRTIKEIAAKAGAESAGKTRPEQALIQAGAQADTSKAKDEFTLATGKAALDTQKAQADAALKLDDLNQKLATTLANNVREGWDKVDAAAKKTVDYQDERVEKEIAGLVRVQEIQDKSTGEVKALQIAGQKIALEAQYNQQIVKTGADRVAYLQQIASLEAQETAFKIAGLEAEKKDAEALADKAASMAKVAEIQGQIDTAQQQGANQQAAAQAGITAAQRQNNLGDQIGQDISNALVKTLPQSLGTALASSIFDHRKGDSTGKQLGEAVRNVGKQVLGEIFTQAIEKLISTVLVQTGLQAALNALFPTVQTAQTAALISAGALNTTAIVTAIAAAGAAGAAGGAAGGVAGAAGSAAGGVAGAAGSAAGAAAGGLVGPLIAAVGGIIGGVISGVMDLIGAHEIVKSVNATTSAVNGTTAAVNALRGTAITPAGAQTSSTGIAPAPTQAQQSFLMQLLNATIGPFGGGNNAQQGGAGTTAIVQAQNATTQAVNALHGTATTASGTVATQTQAQTGMLTQIWNALGPFPLTGSNTGTAQTGQGKPSPLAPNSSTPIPVLIAGFDLGGIFGSPSGLFKMLGFAGGTGSAPGGWSLIGEKGPEIVNLPRGSQVVPNHAIRKYADGTPGYRSTSFQTGTTNLHFHAHGMSDPNKFIDHVMRKLPDELKRRSPQFSAYSH